MIRTMTLVFAVALLGAVAAPAAARSSPPPPPCDASLQVCDVIDPATGKARVWPRDVAKFQTDLETCIHFAGEEAYDAARGRQIAAAVKRFCGGADRAQPRLLTKYAKSPLILDRVKAIIALKESAL
jgi:hypothetical protein